MREPVSFVAFGASSSLAKRFCFLKGINYDAMMT